MRNKPKVVIIGTGGTIAGRAESATQLSYDAAELSISELLGLIPGLNDLADISAKNLFSLNSKEMGPSEWLQLARCVESCVNNEDVDGIVITHGTDTLEEAALFLELTLSTNKPVVITGSMRAATALGTDGPPNLYQAVQVSASRHSIGRGVLVVFNGEIISGLRVIKSHSIATDAFSDSIGGLIGAVYHGHVFFFTPSGFSPLYGACSSALQHQNLPQVGVHYVTAGEDKKCLTGVISLGLRGLVIAGFGSGEIPDTLLPVVLTLTKQGVVIVISSRVNHNAVMPETMTLDEGGNIIASRHFNPHKSAVLLALALATRSDPVEMFTRGEASN